MSIPQEPAHATTGTAVERCHSCGARLRPEDAWCTLCHAPVHPDAAAGAPDAAAARPVADEPVADEPVADEPAADEPAAGETVRPVADETLEPGVARSELAAAARAVVAAHERAAGDHADEYDETDEELRARKARDEETERMLEALSVTESATLSPRLTKLSPDNRAAGAVLAVLAGCAVLAVLMASLAVVGRFL